MGHLVIRNLGPLNHVDIELGHVNVLIGPQSSGKSSLLKIACYCAWVEKRIELMQSAQAFENSFFRHLLSYHKMDDYDIEGAYIEYESDNLKFSYEQLQDLFKFEWKRRWAYHKTKVSYIPAERNLVAAIRNWRKLEAGDDILDFMTDWDRARLLLPRNLDILNLGVSYRYDKIGNSDRILIENGREISFANASSGLQSLIPLHVILDYLSKWQYENKLEESVENMTEKQNLRNLLFKELLDTEIQDLKYRNYTETDHSDIFLEEPEENLFPPTQVQLVNRLLEMAQGAHKDRFFIATHSPYIMTAFLDKNPEDFRLFFTYPLENGRHSIKAASEEEIQEIYDNGVDLFFNFESFLK